MSAYAEILAWSADRPAWQRDALRMLVSGGEVDDEQLSRLVRVCKASQKLLADGDDEAVCPLAGEHVPQQPAGGAAVCLANLHHVGGVNALAAGQSLKFEPTGLTVVYGDNGAGKSGYARILKRLCRARVQEAKLEPNVFSPTATNEQSVVVTFAVAGESGSFDWKHTMAAGQVPRELAGISVFDAASASAYLTTPEKAPFAPVGLDVLEKLAKVCERMKARLDAELAAEPVPAWPVAAAAEGTAVWRLLQDLKATTRDEDIEALALFGSSGEDELGELSAKLDSLSTVDPQKKARELTVRAQRLDAVATTLGTLEQKISDSAMETLWQTKLKAVALAEAARAARETALSGQPLAGVGEKGWGELWDAARRYSTSAAYPGAPFPAASTGAAAYCANRTWARRRVSGS